MSYVHIAEALENLGNLMMKEIGFLNLALLVREQGTYRKIGIKTTWNTKRINQ